MSCIISPFLISISSIAKSIQDFPSYRPSINPHHMGGTVAPKPPGLPRAERRNGGLGSGLRQLDGGTWSHVGSPEKAADQQPTMTGGRLINHPFKHKHYGDYLGMAYYILLKSMNCGFVNPWLSSLGVCMRRVRRMKSIMRMSMMVEVRVIVVIVIVMMALLSDGVAVAGSFSPKPHHCCPKRVASSQLSPAFREAFGAHVTLRTCHRWVPQRPLWQGLVLNLGPLTVVLSTTWHEFKPQKMPRWACEQHWYGHISLQNTFIYIYYTYIWSCIYIYT